MFYGWSVNVISRPNTAVGRWLGPNDSLIHLAQRSRLTTPPCFISFETNQPPRPREQANAQPCAGNTDSLITWPGHPSFAGGRLRRVGPRKMELNRSSKDSLLSDSREPGSEHRIIRLCWPTLSHGAAMSTRP